MVSKEQFFLVFISFLLTAVYAFILWTEGPSWLGISGFILFAFTTICHLFMHRIQRWTDARNERKMQEYLATSKCQFKENHILFPEGYEFEFGYLKDKTELPYALIDEMRVNTFPPSVKINQNELIFLSGLNREECEAAALEYDIPICTPTDNWALLCEPFLDTEHSAEYELVIQKKLNNAGFLTDEVAEIRKRIENKMLWTTAWSWEWMHYGQYDVLETGLYPLNEEKYWWSMEIALREKE